MMQGYSQVHSQLTALTNLKSGEYGDSGMLNASLGYSVCLMSGWGWKSVRSSRRTDHGTTNFQNVALGLNDMAMRLQPGLSVTEGAIVQHATQPCGRLFRLCRWGLVIWKCGCSRDCL